MHRCHKCFLCFIWILEHDFYMFASLTGRRDIVMVMSHPVPINMLTVFLWPRNDVVRRIPPWTSKRKIYSGSNLARMFFIIIVHNVISCLKSEKNTGVWFNHKISRHPTVKTAQYSLNCCILMPKSRLLFIRQLTNLEAVKMSPRPYSRQ